jgi:hypothetical protein
MSIINEAIKKARNESRLKQTGIETDMTKKAGPILPPSYSPDEPSETKWTLAVILSLVLTISLLGSVLLYKHVSRLNIASTPLTQNPVPENRPNVFHPAIQTTTLPATKIEDAIELNGIVYGPDDKWAIINNRIVREGDSILDAKISLIKKDFVKITKGNGEEIILELR